MEVLCVAITGVCTIVVACIGAASSKHNKETAALDATREEQSKQRASESMLLLKLMNADCALTVGTALALQRGHCNGEMEAGLEAVKEAQEEYAAFHDSIALAQLNK